MMPRVLVTGGSGFIGTNLVEEFRREGAPVLNLDLNPPINPAHADLWHRCDILDATELATCVREFGPTHVYHLAARTDLHGTALSDYAANTVGVKSTLSAVAGSKSVERSVFASSRMVCRIGYAPRHEADYRPPNSYGGSKVIGERLVRDARLPSPWIIVRPTSIWGPWFGVPYRDFFLAVLNGRYMHVRGRRVMKSFGYVGNTCFQLRKLITGDSDLAHGRTLYLGDYPPICVNEMAELIRRSGSARRIPTVPLLPLRAVARTGDLLTHFGWTDPPLTSFRLDNLLTEMVFDLRELEECVGPLPYSLEQGVVQTLRWMRTEALVPTMPTRK